MEATRRLADLRGLLWPGVVGALCLVCLAGCGGKEIDVVPLTDSEKNLTHIALAFGDAHTKLGRGPKNADELKPFLKPFGDPEQLLISPNDGKPYVVIWGANPTAGGPTDYQGMFPILAYESEGTSGKRAITDIRGRPLTIPQEDLSKLKFAGRHKPAETAVFPP